MKKILILLLAISMLSAFVVGCTPGKDSNGDKDIVVDLEEIHAAVKESLGEDYSPNMEISAEELENITGVKVSDMESYIAEAPMISVNIDTFIAIKAKEGKAEAIEEGLEAYRKDLIENSLQYPMNLAKVNATKVVRNGDYIFFLMLGRYDDREDATEEERLEFAQDEVKKIEDIINKFF